MGLDQYAFARKGEPFNYRAENLFGEEQEYVGYPEQNEIAYWRKHPNLQGWMERRWREKNGHQVDNKEFNCVDFELDTEDLESLELDVLQHNLPPTTGFFFGENSDEEYFSSDLSFVKRAKEAIQNGYTVVYSSWW
jgi:hypothetical protein